MAAEDVVTITNRDGRGRCLLVCDHASNRIPPAYGGLGLSGTDQAGHTFWDPGALAVAERLSALLDAPLVASRVSRLVIDCNRAHDAPDLIPVTAEGKPVPGNADVDAAERLRRIRAFHDPFHDAIEAVIAAQRPAAVIAIHSFTPVFFGKARPWTLGILHDDDTRLADAMIGRLDGAAGVVLGRNQPYSPADGVYYTLGRHGDARGLATVMIEIRNDQVADTVAVARWAALLGKALDPAVADATGA